MAPLDTGLAPTTSPELALRRIVASCQADLRKHRAMVLRSRRPVGVHQTRVALRRMRAAFGLFRAAVDGPLIRSLNAEARWLAAECGPARDLHVFLTETVEGVPPEIRRVANRLESSYLQRARAALGSARFDAFDRQLDRFMDLAPAPADEDRLDAFARKALGARHAKVLKRGRGFAKLDIEGLHELRIALKKLRYAAEFLRPAFASAAVKPYIEATVRLQGALGALNDRAVARHVLADLATAARPTEDVKKPLKHLARQSEGGDKRRRRALDKAWQSFRKAETFW
jgi:CHAD domain-containing protein